MRGNRQRPYTPWRWDTPESIATGAITGLNFGELGLDASQLDDSVGLARRNLASSGQSGMVLAVGPGQHGLLVVLPVGMEHQVPTLQLELFRRRHSVAALTIGGVTKRDLSKPREQQRFRQPARLRWLQCPLP